MLVIAKSGQFHLLTEQIILRVTVRASTSTIPQKKNVYYFLNHLTI